MQKLAGQDPAQLKRMLEALQKKGKLTPEERQLSDYLALLIEAAKSGNSSIFNKSMGGGGALRNLVDGLGGGRSLGGLFGNDGGRGGGIDWSNFKPWSDADKQFLDKALNSDPEHFGDQIESWRQGQEGNCSTVACIKAAIDRFDNRVLDDVQQRADGGYDVRMQDGFELGLSPGELSMAKAASNFRGTEESKAYPQMLYAAVAKRAVMEGRNGSFSNALWDLNNGFDPRTSARLLGLNERVVSLNPYTLNNQDAVVAWSQRHAIFVNRNADGSHSADHYGRAYRFNGTDTNGWGLRGAYTFKPRPEALDQIGPLRSDLIPGRLSAPLSPLRSLGPNAWRPNG